MIPEPHGTRDHAVAARLFRLTAHPGFPSSAIEAIDVTIDRAGGQLDLGFVVVGAIGDVAWPGGGGDGAVAGTAERRADELWRHTCFESFVAPADAAGYVEVNLATSGHWAGYAFDAYRAGMRQADVAIRRFDWRFMADRAEIRASIALAQDAADWAVNLTAIIETKDGGKSYWALAHGDGPPDFHVRTGFAALLPA